MKKILAAEWTELSIADKDNRIFDIEKKLPWI